MLACGYSVQLHQAVPMNYNRLICHHLRVTSLVTIVLMLVSCC